MSVDEVADLAESDAEPGTARRAVIVLIALGVLGAAVALVVASRGDDHALAELRLRGDSVSVRTGKEFVGAIEGQGLHPGDAVRTDASGEAQIDYFTESLTRLDHRTTVTVTGLVKTDTSKQIRLTLQSGRIWNHVAPLDSAEDRYEVRAGDAIATVRGTTFYIDCRSRDCYFVGVADTTEVSSSSGQTLTVGPDQCVKSTGEGALEPCDAKALVDDWVLANLAEEGQDSAFGAAATTEPTVSPTETTSSQPRTSRRRRVVPRATTRPPAPQPTQPPASTQPPPPSTQPPPPSTAPPTEPPPPTQGPTEPPPTST